MIEEGAERAAPARFRPSARWRIGIAAAAAAVLIAAAIGWSLPDHRHPPETGRSFALPSGEGIDGASGTYTADLRERFLTLPDETRLRLEPGTTVQFRAPQKGERVNLSLESGAVEADVVSGKGSFRITAPAGEVRVLGTHLRVAALDLKPAGPALCVEVESGLVQLAGLSQQVLVSAGQRGAVVRGGIPETQEKGKDWQALLQAFALQKKGSDRASLLAAFLLGSRWERPLELQEFPADAQEIRHAKQSLREMRPQ